MADPDISGLEDVLVDIRSCVDYVNHPPHYTAGRAEAIDIIEDAIAPAPTPEDGYAHGQALKYLLRLWLKKHPLEDARKAHWYLQRLIWRLEGAERPHRP